MNDRVAASRPATLVAGLLLATIAVAAPLHAAETPVERGRYLVETILACGNCHTPRDANGQPIRERNLAGGLVFDIPPFAGAASNITPDRETGIGAWTDEEIKRAIIHGQRPARGREGGQLAPLMASGFFKAMLPSDLDAVVAYLRSLPPIRNPIPAPTYRMRVPAERYPEADRGFTAADMNDRVRRGAYLATIGHCMECHTPAGEKGRTLYETSLGAGGKQFAPSMVKGLPATWHGATARNITSHPDAGLGRWTDAEIKRAITHAVSRDGRKLQPPMAYAWYAGMRDEDLDAIVAYLRTIPPKP